MRSIFLLFFITISNLYGNIKYAKLFSFTSTNSKNYELTIHNKNNNFKKKYLILNSNSNTFALNYTSESAFLFKLKKKDNIIAINNPINIYNNTIHELIKKKKIIAFKGNYQTIPVETLLSLKPSYYSIDIFNKNIHAIQILKKKNIKTIHPIYFLEKTPLAKAEWIKFYGILVNELNLSKKIFNDIERNYLNYKKKLNDANIRIKPNIILELPYQGSWYVSRPNSLMGKYLQDSKANYLVKNNDNKKLSSLVLTKEDLIHYIHKADVWVINSSSKITRNDIYKKHPYLIPLKKKIKNIKIFTSTKRLHNNSNDIFESGDLYVDKVLHDFINMIHPNVLEKKKLFYYEEI